jgi:hypothetical protein
MLRLNCNKTHLKILCLGAHCDDIEIGCGGTILKLAEDHPILNSIGWSLSNPPRAREAEASAGLS